MVVDRRERRRTVTRRQRTHGDTPVGEARADGLRPIAVRRRRDDAELAVLVFAQLLPLHHV